jgi:hybrid cluster-associated redox disulfide protein
MVLFYPGRKPVHTSLRLRKEARAGFAYTGSMNTMNEISAWTTVSDLLTCCPECIPIFLGHRMACVGCLMARFDTLSDAASNYRLPVETLLLEIRAVVQSPLKE